MFALWMRRWITAVVLAPLAGRVASGWPAGWKRAAARHRCPDGCAKGARRYAGEGAAVAAPDLGAVGRPRMTENASRRLVGEGPPEATTWL